jgi:hypothetical protein
MRDTDHDSAAGDPNYAATVTEQQVYLAGPSLRNTGEIRGHL